jgi:hypothetical protein
LSFQIRALGSGQTKLGFGMRGLLLLVPLVFALPALAQGLRGDLFPSDGACYLRFYGDAHMASHPDQRVTEIAIGPDAAQTTVAALAVRLQVQTRDSDDFYTGIAYCTDAGSRLECGIEGDSGGFTLQLRADALQLNVGDGGIFLEGPSDVLAISGTTGDDRTFRLPPVPADSCP